MKTKTLIVGLISSLWVAVSVLVGTLIAKLCLDGNLLVGILITFALAVVGIVSIWLVYKKVTCKHISNARANHDNHIKK